MICKADPSSQSMTTAKLFGFPPSATFDATISISAGVGEGAFKQIVPLLMLFTPPLG
jgi:hypothetical protein